MTCEQIDRAIAAASGRDVARAAHEVRKRCKRIRALLRIVRPQLGDVFAAENDSYRDIARGLSELRDAEIVTRAWPIEEHGSFEAIELGLKKSYATGRRALDAAFATPSAAAKHDLCNRAKDHAHQLAALRSTWKGPLRARRKAVERLADVLGDDHDFGTPRRTLLGCADAIGSPDLLATTIGLIERRRVELRIEAHDSAALIYAEKPNDFVRRMQTYWRVWRKKPDAAHVHYRPKLVTA